MSKDFNCFKIKTESIIVNIEEKNNNNIENNLEIGQILQPLKDQIEIVLKNNGSYSLIACILEIFYDKKVKMLQKEEILNEIKKVMKNNSIITTINTFSENIFLNSRNCFFKTNQILDYNENFMKFSNINNSEEIIEININKIINNLDNIIKELLYINNKKNIIISISNPEKNFEENQNKKEMIMGMDKSKNEEIKLNNNKNSIIKEEIINTDIFPKKRKRKRKKFLKIKRKLKHNLLSFHNKNKDFLYNSPKKFTSLSIESLSFNCNPKKQEKIYIEQKINDIFLENEKILKAFDEENIVNIEEKKIKDLNQEILIKNIELQLHKNILISIRNNNLDSQNNNINIKSTKKIFMEMNKNYEEFKIQLDILSLFKNYIYKAQKDKNNKNFNENLEIMKKIYQNNFENCKLFYNNIEKNKNQYSLCLKNMKVFIRNINNFSSNSTESINCIDNNVQNIKEDKGLIYLKEKQIIDNIINNINEFTDIIKKNFYDCISDTPFEKELINQKY